MLFRVDARGHGVAARCRHTGWRPAPVVCVGISPLTEACRRHSTVALGAAPVIDLVRLSFWVDEQVWSS